MNPTARSKPFPEDLRAFFENDSVIVAEACTTVLATANSEQRFDYALVALGYFKVAEIELMAKVFRPYANYLAEHRSPLSIDPSSNNLGKELQALVETARTGKSKGLGDLLAVLECLSGVTADSAGGLLEQLKVFLRQRLDRPYYLYGKHRVAARLREVAEVYRNPYVHSLPMPRDRFDQCHDLLCGRAGRPGLLDLMMRSLAPSATSTVT